MWTSTPTIGNKVNTDTTFLLGLNHTGHTCSSLTDQLAIKQVHVWTKKCDFRFS